MSGTVSKLDEQKKIIEFLTSKYEKDTGRKISIPSTLGQLLEDDSIVAEEQKPKVEDKINGATFGEAVEALRLPKGEVPKKGEKKKNPIQIQPHHMLEKIDLSGFKLRRFSRAGMKELLEGLALLPCIRSLSLRNNGITDEFDREVLEIFTISKIKCIDLSNNAMCKLGSLIGKKLKDECNHVQWIDLTQNEFYNDSNANSLIIQGLKKQTSLIYVGLSVQGQLAEQLVKLVQTRRPPFNLNMRNTMLTEPAADYLFKSISSNECYLTGLSLKFCYLSFEHLLDLASGIRFNKTLVKLNLSNNGFKSPMVKFLLDSLLDNVCLMELDFGGNFLDDSFANDLALVLEHNPVLYKVDISKNPIGPEGASVILNALLVHNETLGSLGNLDENMYMGVRIREELRQTLYLNNTSHDKKRAYVKDLQEQTRKTFVNEKQVDNPTLKTGTDKKKIDVPASQQAAYPLLKPVTFTNASEDDYLSLGVWNLK